MAINHRWKLEIPQIPHNEDGGLEVGAMSVIGCADLLDASVGAIHGLGTPGYR